MTDDGISLVDESKMKDSGKTSRDMDSIVGFLNTSGFNFVQNVPQTLFRHGRPMTISDPI